MSLFSSILAMSLLGFTSLIVPPALLGQASTSETTAPADSQPAAPDSVPVSGVYHAPNDTTARGVRPDTASRTDTASSTSDTIRAAGADTAPASPDTSRAAGTDTTRAAGTDTSRASADTTGRNTARAGGPDTARARASDTAAASAAPTDSILSAACDDLAGGATVAQDLLVVVFAPEAGAAERAAVAETVQGKLLGPVTGEPGAYYLRLPHGGAEWGLRTAADELIQLAQVRQVGSRSCPSATGT